MNNNNFIRTANIKALFTLLSCLLFLDLACNMDLWPLIFNHDVSQNRILFTSNRSGKDQLYTMNPDGTDIQQITSGEWFHTMGRWSPDKKKIVCLTEDETSISRDRMAVMNSDGSNSTFLARGYFMAWHPNGNNIVYIYWPGGAMGSAFKLLYSIDISNSNGTQLTADSLETLSSPCYTPDGSEIYFGSNRHNPPHMNYLDLYKMNSDGSNVTRVTTTVNGSSYSPCVSPSGKRIVYMSRMGETSEFSINILDIETNNIHYITTSPENIIYNFPRWSPDERYIIFTAGNSHYLNVCRINVDGSGLVTLEENAHYADW